MSSEVSVILPSFSQNYNFICLLSIILRLVHTCKRNCSCKGCKPNVHNGGHSLRTICETYTNGLQTACHKPKFVSLLREHKGMFVHNVDRFVWFMFANCTQVVWLCDHMFIQCLLELWSVIRLPHVYDKLVKSKNHTRTFGSQVCTWLYSLVMFLLHR